MLFTTTVAIDAPPARVWAVMQDVERWHEWTASITSITRLDPGPLDVGTRVRIRQPRLPAAVWRMTAMAPERGFAWVSRAPGVHVTAHHDIEAVGEGSRVTLTLTYAGLLGPLIGRMTRTLTTRYIGLEAAGLKARAERG